MGTESSIHTLYEDWQVRRQRLMSVPSLHPLAYRDIQLHVLDYLLDRYRESPEVATHARFPMPAATWFNHRAIVVHHHLGSGKVGGVKTAQEARQRVSAIVKRISTAHKTLPDVHIKTLGFDFAASAEKPMTYKQQAAVQYVLYLLRWRADAHRAIDDAIRVGAILPRKGMEYLIDLINDESREDLEAVDLLSRCRNRSAVNHAVLAWRRRLEIKGRDRIAERLRELFLQPDVRQQAADHIRAELAHGCAAVRMEAASILGDMADLADIGLFLDLLSLPPQADEDPQERPELIAVMRKLARMAT
jgi:hypothetical protein